jgi:formylglycine-generating enzyme required for sulfatase activity
LAFFPSVLERIRLILENEHEGATGNLAAALVEVRKDIRRHPLPDLDSDLDERTQALFLLRGERGNLIEALENALDACQALAMPLRANPEGGLELPREAVQDNLLRALDERLRGLDSSVTRLAEAVANADTVAAAAGANHSVNQYGLFNLSVRELKVDIAAARFEAKSAADPGAPPTIDLEALARTLEAIRDTARELRELVQTLHAWVTPAVVAAGRIVAAGAERAWGGLKTLVRKVRYERELSQQAQDTVPKDHSKPFRPPLQPLTRWREPIPGLPEEAWPDMINLPPGRFLMGAPESEEGSKIDERPQLVVTILRPFALGRTAVTFAMWDAAIAAGFTPPGGAVRPNDAGWGRGQRPVINVSLFDATAYCDWLNKVSDGGYRLPAEEEWEYGCRAGTTTPYNLGTSIALDQANFLSATRQVRAGTVPVGSLPANNWGLHEMHGNVWEWVIGRHESVPGRATALRSSGDTDPGNAILRGGSWANSRSALRSAVRGYNAPENRSSNFGFRLARTMS